MVNVSHPVLGYAKALLETDTLDFPSLPNLATACGAERKQV